MPFGKNFLRLRIIKLSEKNKKTVLKYKSESRGRFRTVLSKTYTFSDEIHIVPVEVSEMISYSSTGRNNIQAYNKFYFENINHRQHFEMHPAISRKLRSFI